MANTAQDLIRMSKKIPPQLRSAQIRWEMVLHRNGNEVKLCPSEPPPMLFRGQHTQHSPSYPSIARGIRIPKQFT